MVVVLVEIHDIADWLLQRNQSWWRIFVMIRKMQNIDIDRVADIWLKTNLKAHYFIPEQYWTSNYELVKEMMSQAEVYVYEDDKMIQGFVGLSNEYIEGIFA